MADGDFPVFAPNGTMLGNMTGNQGQVPKAAQFGDITTGNNFSLADQAAGVPAVGGAASTSAPSIASAASSAGITGGSIPPAATTGATNATTGAAGVANSWFARGAIVILGFVFVAVGLSQFGILQKVNPVAR